MDWDLFDFAVFGALVGGVAVLYRLAARRSDTAAYRRGAGVALGAAFLLVWMNGAVGIIGTESDDANLMFFGVLAVAAIGALVARFRAAGLALALIATALAQVLVAAIALAAGLGATDPGWPWEVVTLSGFFAALWLLSAWLFRKAARQGGTATVIGGDRE